MPGIIKSILDTDLYKITMQKAILTHKQRVPVEYIFNNRRPEGKFNYAFANAFADELENMSQLRMDHEEVSWLQATHPWLGEDYIQYLRNYRFDPRELSWTIKEGELDLRVKDGTMWERGILWEVPLMSVISELYFLCCDTNWVYDEQFQIDQFNRKGRALDGYSFTDFGTRRRRDFRTQNLCVETLKKFSTFRGTSNVHLARLHEVKALGTMAHEFIMGISALEGLRHANRFACQIWQSVYKGNLGTALPDTFGTDAFFQDFDGVLARSFDSVRHDSGHWLTFAEKAIKAYNDLGIDPMTKSIIFSDGLDIPTCLEIAKALTGRIKFSFGIGTNLTNDYPGSKPLNMVIKLSKCNGIPVVKLSDTPSKAIGDKDALRVAKWTFFNTPLDAV